MSSNKSAKNKLIKLYGAECFIEKLKLRQDDGKRYYSSKKEYQRMKQLTYHHILEKSKGGKATIENGALLSAENHAWFHRQTASTQSKLKYIFQQYKLGALEIENGRVVNNDIINFVCQVTKDKKIGGKNNESVKSRRCRKKPQRT